jgi:hypothetical protein
MLAGVERTSLFCLKIKAAAKKVFKMEFWVQCYKTFFVRDLHIFVLNLCLLDYTGKSLPMTNILAYYKNS